MVVPDVLVVLKTIFLRPSDPFVYVQNDSNKYLGSPSVRGLDEERVATVCTERSQNAGGLNRVRNHETQEKRSVIGGRTLQW